MNIPQPEKKYILTDIIKKRKHQQDLGEQRRKAIQEKIRNKKQKEKDFIHPEKFVQNYVKQQTAYAYFKIKARKQSLLFETGDVPINKTLLVVRIRGVLDISDKQKQILRSLRLHKVNFGVFVKSTLANLRKLKLVENYITYGLPSRQLISQLILKRGHTIVEKEVIPLKSNEIIEQHLGEQGLICIEDLVNDIADCTDRFDLVTSFLAPFKLNHPQGALQTGKLKKPLQKGGEWGYREDRINALVQEMI
ncbi:hypothetical protein pb186bvf_011946 [Paramecium bursaria]